MVNNLEDSTPATHSTALKTLLEMVPPRQLRRSVENLFFSYYAESDHPQLTKDQVRDIQLLIEFLDEME